LILVDSELPTQFAALRSTGWTGLDQHIYDSTLPDLTLTDEELRDDAQTARAAYCPSNVFPPLVAALY
jgi:hypothetical protein